MHSLVIPIRLNSVVAPARKGVLFQEHTGNNIDQRSLKEVKGFNLNGGIIFERNKCSAEAK